MRPDCLDSYLEASRMVLNVLWIILGILLVVLGGVNLAGALLPALGKGRRRGSRSAASAFLHSIGLLAYGSAIIVWLVMLNHHSSVPLAGFVMMSGALIFILAVTTASYFDRKRKL
jgi:hypothetical protein